jgi:urease accessory protein
MRGDGPTIFTSIKEGTGVGDIADLILASWKSSDSPGKAEPVGKA